MFGLNEGILSLITNIRNWNFENTSVVYPIYQRTGDKSDGNFNPASNVTLAKNVYQWDTVNIPAGVTVTAKAPGLLLLANSVTISGLLTASGLGARGGSADSEGIPAPGENGKGLVGGGGGGGYQGANGGNGRAPGGVGGGSPTAGVSDVNAFFTLPDTLGCPIGGGGGASSADYGGAVLLGGNGGGYIYIVCKNFILNAEGAIRAEGLNGVTAGRGSGGGGGGVIVVDALTVVNNGTISVAGGAGGVPSYPHLAGKNGGAGCKLVVQRGLR